MRSPSKPSAPRHRLLTAGALVAVLLVPCLLLGGGVLGGSVARAGEDRPEGLRPGLELEPLPRAIAFPLRVEGRFNTEARRQIDLDIQRTFASLGDVPEGRELLVRRFGLLSASALTQVLRRSSNETETWNAMLTIAALRDVEGGALELKPAITHLVKLAASRSHSPHTRALACIALGCYPWPEGVLPKRYEDLSGWYSAVPGPARDTGKAVKDMGEARRVLVKRAGDKLAFSSVSALLAMAKRGGDALRDDWLSHLPPPYANSRPKRAMLLARAFFVVEDPKPYVGPSGLANDESGIRSAAALAIAVSLLQEKPAAWTHEGAKILKQLRVTHPLLPGEREAVFARGVCAYVNQIEEEWRALWRCATTPSTKRNCAEAAAQMLVFLDLPWFRTEILSWAKKPGSAMKECVLSLVLLRAGRDGSPEAFAAVSEWLRSAALRPSSKARWDPRWYATIGILRALHDGRLTGQDERRAAVELLRSALGRRIIHKDALIRPALERVLEQHGERLSAPAGAAPYLLPLSAVRAVEESFVCPHGLLAADPTDACVRRVNDAARVLWGLAGLSPNKPGEVGQQAERYLKRYVEVYPYFSRLEFRSERGFRPLPGYSSTSPLVLDR